MGWKKRNLMPFGKITIIKTFILSKFNHIFTCSPSPSAHFYKSFTKMLYDFLWHNKPDKIKRIQISRDYKNGGLRMVNIENFQKNPISWPRQYGTIQTYLKELYFFHSGSSMELLILVI